MHISRDARTRLGNRLLFLLAGFVHLLPLASGMAFGRFLGRLAPRFSPKHFRRVCTDITAAFGEEMTPDEVEQLARLFYIRLGESLVEFLRIPTMTSEQIMRWARVEGLEYIDAARAEGKGVVFLTAHLANWELCGVRVGLTYPVTAIARPQEDTMLTNFLTQKRETHGMKIVSMTDIRGTLRALKENDLLGILGDVNARIPGAFINFFGRPTSTYTGAAYLAITTGAPLLTIFDERLPDNTHCLRVGPPIPVSRTGDRQRDMLITMMRGQYVIEQEIRRRPQDWYWLLHRWKTRPDTVPQPDRIPMEHRDLTPEEIEEALAPVRQQTVAVP